MKLELDFIKNILGAIESQSGSRVTLGELLSTLGLKTTDGERLDVFAGHVRIMRDAGFITCWRQDCGFMKTRNSPIGVIHTGSQYEMRLEGYQMLDALRNDNLMGKIKSYLSEMGTSGLKKAPGFIIGVATQYMMKSQI